MATVTKTYTSNNNTTFTLQAIGSNVTATGSTFSVSGPTLKGKYAHNSYNFNAFYSEVNGIICIGQREGGSFSWSLDKSSTAKNTLYTYSSLSTMIPNTFNTADVFTSNNRTTRTLNIDFKTSHVYFNVAVVTGGHPSTEDEYSTNNHQTWSGIATVTLNAPPTATIGNLTKDLPDYYSGKTTVSVALTDIEAKYGGSIDSIKLEVGNNSETRVYIYPVQPSSTETLSMILGGYTSEATITPKVTITDSRGQTTSYSLSPITILPYTVPASVKVSRINSSTFKADDEGTNAVIQVRIEYNPFTGNYLTRPTTTIDGTIIDNDSMSTHDVTWYTSWSANEGFSGAVTWGSYQPTSPVILYGKVVHTFDTNTTYTIGLTPITTMGSGAEVTDLLPQAFYLLSAVAGGHGLGIGMKVPTSPNNEGFHVGIESTFYTNINSKSDIFVLDATSAQQGAYGNNTFGPNGQQRGIKIAHEESGKSAAFTAIRTDTDYGVFFGVGSGGINRGIYDNNSNQWIIYKDSNNLTRIPGDLLLYGHMGKVGQVVENYLSTAKSVATSTWTSLFSFKLTAGTWIVIYGIRTSANSTGYRQFNIAGTSAATDTQNTVVTTPSGTYQARSICLVRPTSETTYYMNVWQNSGSSLSYSASGSGYGNFAQAVRIC